MVAAPRIGGGAPVAGDQPRTTATSIDVSAGGEENRGRGTTTLGCHRRFACSRRSARQRRSAPLARERPALDLRAPARG
ncbi:hypothetical protein CDD83_981 [Cordyceps sp. RAO-2017]|nr:hypothetical protein CDD83_981 [Cordyceps sp. RAO-2017]